MRNSLVVAIAVGVFTINGFGASADSTPSPSPTPSIDSFKAAQEQFRKDRDIYIAALREREQKIRIINSVFNTAVLKANSDAKNAMAVATTPDQKNSINSTRRAAISAAIVARETAIATLGPLPTPPINPFKGAKGAPFGMTEQRGKQKR